MYPVEPNRLFSIHNGMVYVCGRSFSTAYYPALFYFADSASGVKNVVASIKAQFYPNPAKNTATLQFTLQSKNNLSLTIADITGKTIWQKPSEKYSDGEHAIQIDTRNFPAGIYHCRLAGSGNELLWSGKLVKE